MTLDKTIERFINNAEHERTHGNLQGCLEFRQLAGWLKELKEKRKLISKIKRAYESDVYELEDMMNKL